MPRAQAAYIPRFGREAVEKLIQKAEALVPPPYIFQSIFLSDKEWVAWRIRRATWLEKEGKPTLERLLNQAYSRGIERLLKEIREGGSGWQSKCWLVERFDVNRFGRMFRYSEASKGKKEEPKKKEKQGRAGMQNALEKLRKKDPMLLRQLHEALTDEKKPGKARKKGQSSSQKPENDAEKAYTSLEHNAEPELQVANKECSLCEQ